MKIAINPEVVKRLVVLNLNKNNHSPQAKEVEDKYVSYFAEQCVMYLKKHKFPQNEASIQQYYTVHMEEAVRLLNLASEKAWKVANKT